MFLVVDQDGNLSVYPTAQTAAEYMETNDFNGVDEEHEMCDDNGQRYIADIIEPERVGGGTLRFVPAGDRDPALPASFVERSRDLSSHIPWVKTMDDIRRELWRAKA